MCVCVRVRMHKNEELSLVLRRNTVVEKDSVLTVCLL